MWCNIRYLNQINEFLTVIIFFSLELTTLQVFFSNVCRTHNYSSREMTLWSETHICSNKRRGAYLGAALLWRLRWNNFSHSCFSVNRNTSILAINGHPSKYRNIFPFLIILHPYNQLLLTKGNENGTAEGAIAQRMTVIRDREKIDK